MSEKQILSLMKKGEKLFKKKQALEALEVFNNVLEISPDNFDALNFKVQLLYKLNRPEDFIHASSKLNLLKLQKDGPIPSDFESPDSWIIDAIKLINKGQDNRALNFLEQAAFISPIVNKEGLSKMVFHDNPKIYYFTAFLYFRRQENYEFAMALFEIANKLEPKFTIPNEIKKIYNDYISNRSGVGVSIIAPLNESNLKSLFPCKDKILVSTEAFAEVKIQEYHGRKIKTKTYTWKTHLLLSDYALAFIGAGPICKKPVYYVPWPFITYNSNMGLFIVSHQIGGLTHSVNLTAILNPQRESDGISGFKYLDKLDIHTLIEMNKNEMIERTMNNMKSLESILSYKQYKKQFEIIPKEIYKDVEQTIKQNRMKK